MALSAASRRLRAKPDNPVIKLRPANARRFREIGWFLLPARRLSIPCQNVLWPLLRKKHASTIGDVPTAALTFLSSTVLLHVSCMKYGSVS